jgi:probable HAF family extracellular repeat protein
MRMESLIGLATTVVLISNAIATTPTYSVTDLGLGDPNKLAINNSGQVLADSFVYFTNGTGWIRNLNLVDGYATPCGLTGQPLPVSAGPGGINNHGQVVVTFTSPSDFGGNCIAVYNSNGTWTDVQAVGFNYATGINDSGQIIGGEGRAPGLGFGPVCDFVNSGDFISANAINGSGQIVGNTSSSVELCTAGVWQVLPNLSGGVNPHPNAINSKGQVVGYVIISNASRAFFYSAGKTKDLGTLPGAVNPSASAESINIHSQIVGESSTATGYSSFLYQGGMLYDLMTLISATDPYKFSGIQLTGTAAINDHGVIVSTGIDSGGLSHLYVLTPSVLN